jgi:hypothetical protein
MVDTLIDPNSIVKEAVISEERLSKELTEQASVAQEILQRQETEKMRAVLTNPSAIALSTTSKEPGTGLNRLKKTVRQMFELYLTNQFVSRAVNIRADTLISKGFDIIGEDEKGVQLCKELIDNSGGVNLFWQLSVNTDIAGDGFLEKVYNMNKNKILRLKHVHPLTLTFRRDRWDRIIVGPDKEPIGYAQYYTDDDGIEAEKNIPKDIIEHLMFNTLGDEFTGISLIQSGYNTIVRLMNMEYSAAEAAIKTANPMIIATCNTKSPMQIAQWGQILGRINGKDQLFIPEGMLVNLLSPGNQNFNDYADYFLDAVVATSGVPKGILLGGSGGSSNRAEEVILTRHFYGMIRSNQHYVIYFFNKIFKEYGELAGFAPPVLVFPDVAEDATLAAQGAVQLYGAGIITVHEAREMIGLEKGIIGKTKISDMESDLKKSDRAVAFPAEPGKAEGSQVGVKAKQKANPLSRVSSASK